MLNCPNCQKELKWLPKGKHTCLCGEVINTDGEDLKKVEITLINVPNKEKVVISSEIQICLVVLSVLALFALGIFFHETILPLEAGIMSTLFNINPGSYKQAIIPFVAAAIIILWFTLKYLRKIRH